MAAATGWSEIGAPSFETDHETNPPGSWSLWDCLLHYYPLGTCLVCVDPLFGLGFGGLENSPWTFGIQTDYRHPWGVRPSDENQGALCAAFERADDIAAHTFPDTKVIRMQGAPPEVVGFEHRTG